MNAAYKTLGQTLGKTTSAQADEAAGDAVSLLTGATPGDAALATPGDAAPPPRTFWIAVLALIQGLACWVIPHHLLLAVLPPLVTAPVAFYCSERYLHKRPWFPSLLLVFFWLPVLASLYPMDGIKPVGAFELTSVAVYGSFCFFALPFIQTWAELGPRGMRPVELSARMNRNSTLLVLACIALIPVCLALGFGLGNIDWSAWQEQGSRRQWNSSTPFYVFSLLVPITFAGTVNWVQISMEKQAGSCYEWPVLPFLRKTIGVISGWVAIVAGLVMAGIVLSAMAQEGAHPSPHESVFLRLMPAAIFWTACSMNVREGRWEDKSRLFRKLLTACALIFPLYLLWCVYVQVMVPASSSWFSAQQHPFWTWQNLSLGVLLVASLGHGLALCLRRWPQWASAVNVGVHLCVLLLLAATRLPVADPLFYEAQAKAAWLETTPQKNDWYYQRLYKDFGRYGSDALKRIFAAQGIQADNWQAALQQSREKTQNSRVAQLRKNLIAMPRLPKDAVLPESFIEWVADPFVSVHDNWLTPSEGQLVVVQDLNQDGKAEIMLLHIERGLGVVAQRRGEHEWVGISTLHFNKSSTMPTFIEALRPVWDDVLINGMRVPLN